MPQSGNVRSEGEPRHNRQHTLGGVRKGDQRMMVRGGGEQTMGRGPMAVPRPGPPVIALAPFLIKHWMCFPYLCTQGELAEGRPELQ